MAVVSSSALKRIYRHRLRAAAPGIVFAHLAGDRALIEQRMSERQGHFMPAAPLDSQFAALQPLGADETGVVVGVAGSPEEITGRALAAQGGNGRSLPEMSSTLSPTEKAPPSVATLGRCVDSA